MLTAGELARFEEALRDGGVPAGAQASPEVAALVEAGLLIAVGRSSQLVPVDPRIAGPRLVSRYRAQAMAIDAETSDIARRLADFQGAYDGAHTVPGALDTSFPVTRLSGPGTVLAHLEELIGDAQEEVLVAEPGRVVADSPRTSLPAHRTAPSPALVKRTLYQHSAQYDSAFREHVDQVRAVGGEVRTLDEFFDRLVIIDRLYAVLPAGRGRSDAAVVLRERSIVDFLVDVFYRHWHRASPFSTGSATSVAAEVRPEIETVIERMLVAGLTDDAIAARVGLRARTVQNYIARIKARFHAGSRSELCYLLGRRDAVPS